MKQQIFIDTDVGLDDIIAITMLYKSGKFKITGFSTVFGLTRPNIGKDNLESLLDKLNISIPIIAGYSTSIRREGKAFPDIDIERSENYFGVKKVQKVQNNCIEDEIFKMFDTPQDLITLGPLTNIAKTIQKYGSDFTVNVRKIVMMGGGLNSGNVPGKLAEYNIWLDPEAANIVFASKIPIVMIGTDATLFVPATKEFKSKVLQIQPNNSASKIIKKVIIFNDSDFSYFYDPLLSAILLDDSIILNKRLASIRVDLARQRGRTTTTKDSLKNVAVPMSIDAEKFYDLLFKIISA